MKPQYYILGIALLAILNSNAQSPNMFNYQAVARSSSGSALPNQSISIQASILDGSVAGNVLRKETFTAFTNINGLFTISIGNGNLVSGTSLDLIPWNSGNKFLSIEIDPMGGTNYVLTSTSQMLSVPYALYASNGDKPVSLTALGGTTVTGTYPNFIINTPSAKPNISLLGQGAATVSGSFPNFIVSAPPATPPVSLKGLGATSVTGIFPSYTISGPWFSNGNN
ncbi:MAG: hypothetical protein K2Q22_04640, partial [Cytophagales bacterium]|nr:hypothetical protein [Cytophagales bacterium]